MPIQKNPRHGRCSVGTIGRSWKQARPGINKLASMAKRQGKPQKEREGKLSGHLVSELARYGNFCLARNKSSLSHPSFKFIHLRASA
jgi:hypothetical protein